MENHIRIISIIGFILVSLCIIRKEVSCNSDIHFNTNLESDRDVLIDFKNGIKDPNNRHSSWKGSNYCQWHGINGMESTVKMTLELLFQLISVIHILVGMHITIGA